MKPVLWRKLAATYLLPQLPGRWHAEGWVLHAEPREWFAPALVVALSQGGHAFSINAIVQFLPVPKTYWGGSSLESTQGRISWDSPSTVDDAAPVMAEVLAFLREQALPYLDRWATLESRLEYLHARITAINDHLGEDLAWQDFNIDEELCYARLITGDRPGAEQAAAWCARAADVDPIPAAPVARDRTARVIDDPSGGLALLREQADFTRGALRVPPLPDRQSWAGSFTPR